MKNTRIGEKIAEYRRKNGLTLRDFAKQTNLSTALLSQLERNIGNPTLSILSTLAEAIFLYQNWWNRRWRTPK